MRHLTKFYDTIAWAHLFSGSLLGFVFIRFWGNGARTVLPLPRIDLDPSASSSLIARCTIFGPGRIFFLGAGLVGSLCLYNASSVFFPFHGPYEVRPARVVLFFFANYRDAGRLLRCLASLWMDRWMDGWGKCLVERCRRCCRCCLAGQER